MGLLKCSVSALALLAVAGAAVTAEARDIRSFVKGEVLRTAYDGVENDLLTGGLGKSGLAGAAPQLSDPRTPEELRILAIYNNYRALVDMTEAGGYGRLYGPNVTADGEITDSEGMVAGVEYLAFGGDASGRRNLTMMVQIPESFDPAEACIVTAPSSGSRGVYGAIATSGEWGLRNGCAVAYTDKGTGIGAHNLQDDTVNLIDGTRAGADEAGRASHFTARLSDRKREAYNAETPNRFAFKHAHSQQNPEASWGEHVLTSVEFAFEVLNREYPEARIAPENTIVIGSSVSNGAGSSILAAEQDRPKQNRRRLIDGIAVSEPNVNPEPGGEFAIVQGDGEPFFDHSRSLYDYTTLLNLYQACANIANPDAPFNLLNQQLQQNRCQSLEEKGLLTTTDLGAQAAEAQAIVNDFGILEEQNVVQPSHYLFFVPQAIAVTYANAYGRFGVEQRLCDYSFGATTGDLFFPDIDDPESGTPIPLPEAAEAALFGTGNGIPPTGGVNLINDNAVEGSRAVRSSTSFSTGRQDHNIDGDICLRDLATGVDSFAGRGLRGQDRAKHAKIERGIRDIRASGDLEGTPTVIVTGRNDGILPPNHTSRAYYGLNKLVEGEESNLRYYEILNAQHLDAFNAFAGFDTRFVPLHHYYFQALDIMFDHLRNGTPLPDSQVVRTTPRGGEPGNAPPIGEENLPEIMLTPAEDDRIVFVQNEVRIPE